jgi:peptidase M1-like protein
VIRAADTELPVARFLHLVAPVRFVSHSPFLDDHVRLPYAAHHKHQWGRPGMRCSSYRGRRVALWAVFAAAIAVQVHNTSQAAPAAAPAALPQATDAPALPSQSPDGIALASPHAGGVREPSSPDAWGGPRTGREPTLSDRVVSYDIAATLDPVAHTVDGRETLAWRNRSDRVVRAVYLHLYLNAFEGLNSTFFTEHRTVDFEFRSEVPVHDGEWGHIELASVRQGGAAVPWMFVHPDNGPETDHTVVRLDLPAPVAPGSSTTLDIAFRDQLPRVVARTGYFGTFHLVGQWFPKIGVLELPGERGAREVQWNVHEFHLHSEFYADYGTFDVKITVPSDYVVGAVGEQQGNAVVSGKMSTYQFVQGDVHDFAWTADNRTAKPLEGQYTGEGSPIVRVRVLFPPEYSACAVPALKAAIDSLAFFSRTLGPYPYRTVTVVIPPFNASEAGGMEYPTFFTDHGYLHPDPQTYDGIALDFVTIHEFGHGYFYGILGSNEFEEPMLDEGLNEYWDMRMLRARSQPAYLGNRLTKWLGLSPVVSGFDLERLNAMRSDPTDPLGANSWDRMTSAGYGSVYFRTATTMHDLEDAVGKELMERAFKEYYARWKFRHPGIADLRESLADATGQRALVNRVFEEQVYATHKVDDAIETFTSVEETPQRGTSLVNGKWTELKEDDLDKQIKETRKAWKKAHPDAKEGTGPFPYRTVLTLRRRGVATRQTVVVKFADGSTQTVVWDSPERWQRFAWVKPVRAVSAEIDPDGHNLLDSDILDDSRTIEPTFSALRRWAGNFAGLIQSILSLASTL